MTASWLFVALSVVILLRQNEAFHIPSCSFIPDHRCLHATSERLHPNSHSLRSNGNDDDGKGESGDVYVMVNGMPGPMATAAAEACLRKGLKLSPVAMTGPDMPECTISVVDIVTERLANVQLLPSTDMDEIVDRLDGVRAAIPKRHQFLAIDYTHPSAVNSNAEFYVKHDIPFVMGTTGGDREKLQATVEGHDCVIAPNMGKQIVAMQSALQELAEKFPASFAGYTLQVTESHQSKKADTSGTAKAVVDSIKTLMDDEQYSYDDIVQLRDDESSVNFGVPEDALEGHAFHTYTMTSPDGTVQFKLSHNVAGRTIYADGTADAVKFLSKKLERRGADGDDQGRVYSMINVLEEGALE